MNVVTVRKANLLKLIEQYKSLENLAELTETSARHLSQMKNYDPKKKGTRAMGHDVARRIEKKLELADGWMDQQHDRAPRPGQRVIGVEALVEDFEQLPPLLQEHVAKVAHDLRELIDGVKPQFRNAISAPPTDPARYREWEYSIKELWSAANQQQPAPRELVKDKKK